ncbi:MAG: alpha-2-macroglobulin family protein [Pseudomonadales bacterium]
MHTCKRYLGLLVITIAVFFPLAATAQEARVLDISAGSLDGRIAAAITFSEAVNGSTDLSQWLRIRDEDHERPEGAWVLSDNAKVLYFTNVEPETKYYVEVLKGLPMAQWQLLPQGAIGEAAIPAVEPMLGFAGNGNLLASSLSDGLPVISVNVPEVDVDFFRIPKSLLVPFLIDNNRRGQLEFWEVESFLDDVDLVYSARFDLKLLRNQSATSYLPIKQIAPLQEQGVYLAVMREAGSYRYNLPVTWFAVSDLGVHMRRYAQSVSISVNSLAEATPQPDVEVSLLGHKGKVLARAQTDAQGLARFEVQALKKAQLVLASKGTQTSLVRLFGPALDLAEFPVEGLPNHRQRLFFYSERDLYRPGEEVRISALLRDADGKLLPAQTLVFELRQPDGKMVNQQRVAASELGYYLSRWSLPTDAATGKWNVSTVTADGKRTTYPIQVEEFLPERMELTLEAPEQLLGKEPLSVSVDGQYLYGAPAAGNTLQSELISKRAAHPFKAFADFHFSNPQVTDFDKREELQDRQLDDRGRVTVSSETNWGAAKTPLQLALYTSLLDSGGRPVSRSSKTFALPASELVGIRPLFADDVAPYEGTASFEVVLSDGRERLAAEHLKLRLVYENRDYHWVYREGEGWRSNYTERHYVVSSKSLAIAAGESVRVSLPVEWGHYRLEVENPQTGVISGYRFRAGWSAEETVMAGRPDRIGLALDRQRYRAGDEVRVDIAAPAPGKGFLLVESDRELLRLPLDLEQNTASVSFALDPAWQTHDLYVSVFLLQPGEQRDARLPRRMMGVEPLRLDRSQRELVVNVDVADKIEPGQVLTVPVEVRAAEGVPTSPVQLTLAAVDVGVLNISRFETPDPVAGFFAQREYAVTARDSYADLINADAGKLAELKFGGDQDNIQGSEADSRVQIVSLFSGPVTVDAQGRAEVALDIPEFNGRLRLMVLAFGEQSFGAVERDIEVAAPVVTQLTMPRFLRSGDRTALALDLDNLSGQTQTLDLTLSLGNGLRFDSTESGFEPQRYTLNVQLEEGQKRTLYLPIAAGSDYRDIEIDLSVQNVQGPQGAKQLNRQWLLPVHPSWAKSSLQWREVIDPGQSFTLPAEALGEYIPDNLRANLSLSARPSLDIASHFSALKAYPYGCLEQTTSGVFPQLYVSDTLLDELGIEGSSSAQRRKAVNVAVQRLLGMQRSSGGFGLWSDQSPEEHWLSVYVLDFMLRARKLGYSVPEQGLDKARQRVGAYLRNPDKISSYRRDIGSDEKIAVRSYAAQVLAREGQAPLSVMRRLFDRSWDSASPMSLVQLGLGLYSAGDSVRGREAIAIASSKLRSVNKHYNSYGSAVRDLALSSFWLLEAEQSGWQPMLLALIERLEGREWLSTQERNALFLLGRELQRHNADEIAVALSLGEQTQRHTLQQLRRGFSGSALHQGMTLDNTGETPVYLNMRARGHSALAPKASDDGLSVERRYYDLSGEQVELREVRGGEKFIVELSVWAEQRTRQALIVDLLPAGLEIENQNLEDSYQQDDLKIRGESIADALEDVDFAHQEYRDDRYVAAVNLPEGRTKRLYYVVRAVSSGTFTVPPTFAEDMYAPQVRHTGAVNSPISVRAR